MDAEKIQVKLFANDGVELKQDAVVTELHAWLRDKKLSELMIDVVPYDHVKNGPHIHFVGHGSDYVLDEGKGRLGLIHSRKREAPAPGERLKDGFRRVCHVAKLLQDANVGLSFGTGEVLIRVNDRLNAPNTDETLASVKAELDAFLAEAYDGAAYDLAREGSERELFSVRVTLKDQAAAPAVDALLARVGGGF